MQKNDHKTIQKLTDPKNRFQNKNIAKLINQLTINIIAFSAERSGFKSF